MKDVGPTALEREGKRLTILALVVGCLVLFLTLPCLAFSVIFAVRLALRV